MSNWKTRRLIYSVADRLDYVHLKPRSNSPLGLFSKYDGNIIGGGLLGAGMALSGSCPGTLLAQIGAGVQTGVFALQGAVLGGILWTGFLSKMAQDSKERAGTKVEASTLPEELGLSRAATVALMESMCIGIVAGTTLYGRHAPEPRILGALGGLFIAGAQLFSILTRRTMMGVSGSYEDLGKYFWWVSSGGSSTKSGNGNIIFATGVFAGAWGLARLLPDLVSGPILEVSPPLAIVGGALMVIGSRMAGGCTSGHGISGMSLLSTSSVITIASAFAVGGTVASLML